VLPFNSAGTSTRVVHPTAGKCSAISWVRSSVCTLNHGVPDVGLFTTLQAAPLGVLRVVNNHPILGGLKTQVMEGLQLRAVESGTWRRAVTLSCCFGTTVLLLGRNGAGKTTLLNTIAGLTRINAGHLLVDGQDLTAVEAEGRVAAGIRIALEGRCLFTRLSVRRNLLLGAYCQAKGRTRC
jgi:hypothetical protein